MLSLRATGCWLVTLASVVAPWFSAAPERPAAPSKSQSTASEPTRVSLGELHGDPLLHLGREVRFRVQIDAENARWNPYVTRFGSTAFRAWRTWADEQFLWRASDWEAPLGVVFARRGSPAEAALTGAARFARFEVVAHVREVFLGRPWLEVASATRLDGEVDEASLVHASRALLLAESERWALAAEAVDQALAGDLPPHAREELWRLRADYRARAASAR